MLNKLTMVMIFFTTVVISMLYFSNTLYYTLVLLVLTFSILVMLMVNHAIQTLTMLLMMIVYMGAMMILISYICAITPNIHFSSNLKSMVMSMILMTTFLFIFNITPSFASCSTTIYSSANFFYSYWGLYLFVLIVFMLFITLLMVTSQYLTPKGPFRSV